MCEAATDRFVFRVGTTRLLPEIGEAGVVGEQVVDGRRFGGGVEAQVERGVGLRVDVDQPDAEPVAASAAAEIHRGRRFADAAFLVDDGDGAHGSCQSSVVGCQL